MTHLNLLGEWGKQRSLVVGEFWARILRPTLHILPLILKLVI